MIVIFKMSGRISTVSVELAVSSESTNVSDTSVSSSSSILIEKDRLSCLMSVKVQWCRQKIEIETQFIKYL